MAAYHLKSRDAARSDHLAVSLAWGSGLMIATLAAGRVSGAHVNPAVSVATAALSVGGMTWRRVPHYVAAQLAGAFAAAVVVHAVYADALHAFDGGVRIAHGHQDATGAVFATYPAPFVSLSGVLLDQVVATAVFVFALLCCGPDQPLCACLSLTAVGVAFGLNAGPALNPARDLAPRLYSALIGYGSAAFASPSLAAAAGGVGGVVSAAGGASAAYWSYWWSAGVAGPVIGALLGALLWRLCLDPASLPHVVSWTGKATSGVSRKMRVSDAGAGRRTVDDVHLVTVSTNRTTGNNSGGQQQLTRMAGGGLSLSQQHLPTHVGSTRFA